MQTHKLISRPAIGPALLMALGCLVTSWSQAQETSRAAPGKLSPRLELATAPVPAALGRYVVQWDDPHAWQCWLDTTSQPVRLLATYAPARVAWLETSALAALRILPAMPWVRFVDQRQHPAQPETPVNGLDLRPNLVNFAHHQYPQLGGQGLTASLKETGIRPTDIDFKGRYLPNPNQLTPPTPHAEFMATILAGGGNTHRLGRGAAWGAQLTAVDFTVLFPEPDSYYADYAVSVQNHSYGVGIENYYGAEAAAFDASVQLRPHLVHVFSAGNLGRQAPTLGPYAGMPGANLTGNFKVASSALVVGATDAFGQVDVLSSRGPTYDGRIKPELVAYGRDGTSGAAALVAGVSVLVQQACLLASPSMGLPPAALVKALLVNGADDLGLPGPDYDSGFGQLNAYRSLQTTLAGQYATSLLHTGTGPWTLPLSLPPGAVNFRATLAWTPPPATPNAAFAVSTDLDLALVNLTSGQRYLPWTRSGFPHPDSLAAPAYRAPDRLNNIERISWDSLPPGPYQLEVSAHTPMAEQWTQAFALAYHWEEAPQLWFTYPTPSDPAPTGLDAVVRWQAAGLHLPAQLDYTLDAGQHWLTLSDSVNLAQGWWIWTPPDTLATARLRLRTAGSEWESADFLLSPPLRLQLGANCPDSVMLYWNPTRGTAAYTLYALDNNYLAPVIRGIDDTIAFVSKTDFPYTHWAVAAESSPALPGEKSFTLDYPAQPLGCYVGDFSANLLAEGLVSLSLRMGSILGITRIEMWKVFPNSGIVSEFAPTPTAGLLFDALDVSPQQGRNAYFARLHFADGRRIDTPVSEVYFWGKQDAFFFPNPAASGQTLRLVVREPGDQTLCRVFNALGSEVYRTPLTAPLTTLQLPPLPPGTYFFELSDQGVVLAQGRLLLTP